MSNKLSHTRKTVAFRKILGKTGNVYPIGSVKYLWTNPKDRTREFSMMMPITGQAELFSVSDELYHNKVIPLDVCLRVYYYALATRILENARDFRPFNQDLSPITKEEKQLFSVNENQPNSCFPMRYGIQPMFRPMYISAL